MKYLLKKSMVALMEMSLVSTALVQSIYANTKIDISKPVQLTWYFIGSGPQSDTEQVEKKINEYLRSKYKMNTKVKLICSRWDTYDSVMKKKIDTKQPFDICFTSNWTNNYYINSEIGSFIALDNLWDQYAPKTKAILGKDKIEATKVHGLGYAIPANDGLDAYQWGFLLREDLVQKYNIDITKIKKIEDIEPYFEIIKKEEQGIRPLEINEDFYTGFKSSNFDMINDIEGRLDYPGVVSASSQEMKVFNEFETPDTYHFFAELYKFKQFGYCYYREIGSEPREHFAEIKRMMADSTDTKFNLTGYSYVKVPIAPAIINSNGVTGTMQAISSTSKNPERAMMFLELVNTDAYLNNLINFGIEGIHYKKVSKNIIMPAARYEKYCPEEGWMFGNQYINYVWDGENANKWQEYKKFDSSASKSKLLGFVFDSKPVESEIHKCQQIWKKYIPRLEAGEADPDVELKKMIEEMKQAGSDKIIAEMQKQLDAWKR